MGYGPVPPQPGQGSPQWQQGPYGQGTGGPGGYGGYGGHGGYGGYGPPPQAAPPPRIQAPLGPPTQEEQNWALMAYLGQFLTSAVAPAVVLAAKGRSPFVRAHARQGLNMAIGALAVWLVGIVLISMADGLAFIPLAYTGAVVFFLVRAAISVNRGVFERVPAVIAWPILK